MVIDGVAVGGEIDGFIVWCWIVTSLGVVVGEIDRANDGVVDGLFVGTFVGKWNWWHCVYEGDVDGFVVGKCVRWFDGDNVGTNVDVFVG